MKKEKLEKAIREVLMDSEEWSDQGMNIDQIVMGLNRRGYGVTFNDIRMTIWNIQDITMTTKLKFRILTEETCMEMYGVPYEPYVGQG